MSEKRKGKQRKIEEEKPTKEEYDVAKYLRFGLPVREGKLHGMEVKCFLGNAAVDKLLESKWSVTNNKNNPLFTTRTSCVSYMVLLLQKGIFHRAEREKRKDKEKSKRKKKEKETEKEESSKPDEGVKERKGKKDRKGKKETDTNGEETDKKEPSEKKEDRKKKEKRLKLVMPEEQFFEDGDEVYVWIYDPVNAKTFFIGLLMVLGAVGLCMFPLWPEGLRVGVYYLSLSAAGFVGFILSLVVVRLILFCCVWVLTLGRHHFWLLPNLTEDVGFFDSFRPLYQHDHITREEKGKEEEKRKRKKKSQKDESADADKKDAEEEKEKSSDKDDSGEFEVIKKEEVGEDCANDGEEEGDRGYKDFEDNGVDEDEDNFEEENDDSEDEEEDSTKEENKKTM